AHLAPCRELAEVMGTDKHQISIWRTLAIKTLPEADRPPPLSGRPPGSGDTVQVHRHGAHGRAEGLGCGATLLAAPPEHWFADNGPGGHCQCFAVAPEWNR